MAADTNLRFIREKIYSLRRGILYSADPAVHSFNNSTVQPVKMDDEGQLWFLCDRSAIIQEEKSFPVRLHFYRKGSFYHVEVSGNAEYVEHVYKGSGEFPGRTLIKMKMRNIEYTDTSETRKSAWPAWLEKIAQWLGKQTGWTGHSKPALR